MKSKTLSGNFIPITPTGYSDIIGLFVYKKERQAHKV